MKYPIFILIFALGIMFESCEKGLDLDGNWIKIKLYEDSQDHTGTTLKSDTLHRNIGDKVRVGVYSQAQPGYELNISMRVNNEITEDLAFFTIGPTLKGYFEENGVIREIYEIEIFLTYSALNSGDEIKVRSEIKSISDVNVEKELIVKIK